MRELTPQEMKQISGGRLEEPRHEHGEFLTRELSDFDGWPRAGDDYLTR